MPSPSLTSRIDTVELKAKIFKKLGPKKSEKYFHNLDRLLSLKLTKLEFKKLLYSIIGKENLPLHNLLIKSILSNACLSQQPCNTKILPKPPRKVRSVGSRDRRLTDRPSPLGPRGKIQELISIGSKAPSVEDGEEVEQARGSPGVAQSRSPVTAPLGLKFCTRPKSARTGICLANYDLPDTVSLKEHLGLSLECANLLNHGLDAYLKRLIGPCVDLARSRRADTGSLVDFRVAVESNRRLLGGDWPVQLEKICSLMH